MGGGDLGCPEARGLELCLLEVWRGPGLSGGLQGGARTGCWDTAILSLVKRNPWTLLI